QVFPMGRPIPAFSTEAPLRIVYCGSGWFPVLDFVRARLPTWATLRRRDLARPLIGELERAQVLLPSNCPLDAATLRACPELVFIQQPAVGVDGIDLQAARELGIPVCNSPGVNAQAVAEAALLLMLMLARRVPSARRTFAAGEIGAPVGSELSGKVLGLL